MSGKGITSAIRKSLLRERAENAAKVGHIAGSAYEPYVYSKPVFHTDDAAVRDVRDKRGNHVRQEFLGGYFETDDRLIYFEEFSTPVGAEGGLLDQWGIPSDLFITGRTKHYLAYVDESRTWALWRKWPEGFPLKAWREERFSWGMVSEDEDGLLDDVNEETNPCFHTGGFSGYKLGFCDDCGEWILDTQDAKGRRRSADPLWNALQ